jgi:hypothetical protein
MGMDARPLYARVFAGRSRTDVALIQQQTLTARTINLRFHARPAERVRWDPIVLWKIRSRLSVRQVVILDPMMVENRRVNCDAVVGLGPA